MENEINIEIDETPKTKPFNVYKLKIALNIIFVILGALMVILLISYIVTKAKEDNPSYELDPQKYSEISIDTYNRVGYYIPRDDNNANYSPKKCSIKNCKKCYGNSKSNICISCVSPHIPVYNNNSVIKACELPTETDDNDSKKIETDKIEKIECDPGYYLPTDDEKACKKCSITNCNTCNGTTNSDICTSCSSGLFENKDEDVIISCDKLCETGIREKCLSCDKNNNICSSCNKGYFLPDDSTDKKVCSQCSMKNCQICSGKLNNEVCNSCSSAYFENKSGDKIISCDKKCETGKNEKCSSCDTSENICSTCNDGYYLPSNADDKKICTKCSVTNCKTCSGSLTNQICNSCSSGYFENYENGNIISCDDPCETGSKEKCLTCDTTQNICASCNNGYYVPTDKSNQKICTKCSLSNCKTCSGALNNDVCDSCADGFFAKYTDQTIISCEKGCTTGTNEKCLTCDTNLNICSSCNDGYYLPTDATDKSVCSKCPINNCKICSGASSSNTCTECFDGFPASLSNGVIHSCGGCVIGEGDKCLTCDETTYKCTSCNDGYELIDGKCVINYSIKATFITSSNNKEIEIINIGYLDYITEIKLDDSTIVKNHKITISKKGDHIIIFKASPKRPYMTDMFRNILNLTSIIFTSRFDTKDIINMDNLFYGCSSLTSVDISSLNFSSVKSMFNIFNNCTSLENIDLSNHEAPELENMQLAFYRCESLTSADFSNFNSPKLKYANSFFNGCSKLKILISLIL